MRRLLAMMLMIGCLVPLPAAAADAASPVLAVTDALALRELDIREQHDATAPHPGFGLRQTLDPSSAGSISNDRLFALPVLSGLRTALDDEFQRYREAPTAARWKLVDRDKLEAQTTRFVLAGVVARIDRGFVAADGCGEVRLIYRPIHEIDGTAQRLPMTLNLVLRARGADGALSCREVARRWLAAAAWPQTGADRARRLMAADGPLAPLGPDSIDRLELNLQIATAGDAAAGEFRADYLLQVFRFDRASGRYQVAAMENQIDRDRLIADRELGQAFKHWLLQPDQLAAFDRGTLIIPETYLARRAIAATPTAFSHAPERPAAGLAGPATADPLISDADIVAALQRAAERGVAFQAIRSPAGFERRLNDITCSGCHQTLGIGGFHVPGVDWTAEPTRRIAAPGSPHFVADQQRRRAIAAAVAEGRAPDYTRGFTDRPELHGSAVNDDEPRNGWGAACGLPGAGGGVDPSFRNWTCAAGLSCQPAGGTTAFPIGMCIVAPR
ncbi:hypothetical protein LPW26_24735 [Rhodopseudomonas sp. HC1]|uniref:hypothetical protein n=1 Tax=Rhodopseudomonas infernalis TaxID=2897386 RepID=UPI001EE7CC48|nr:hypothetical protein [Rhodopseudomonas infernalis]MCG6207869.1 hypothetical protein [Rhodopseudomonas infernalis]